jgi:hypothetical protein
MCVSAVLCLNYFDIVAKKIHMHANIHTYTNAYIQDDSYRKGSAASYLDYIHTCIHTSIHTYRMTATVKEVLPHT